MTDKREQSAWKAHELDQPLYFRSLSLRKKLETVEGMADVVRHFQKVRSEGRIQGTGPDTPNA